MLSEAFLAALLLGVVRAELTPEELAAFSNDGSCGGTVSVTEDGENYIVQSNGLPDHEWQCVNPNAPSAQNHFYTVPKNPDVSGVPYCLNMGVVGIAVNGVPFFSPVTVDTMNAVEGDTEEGFDTCGAHPTADGQHHYHRLPVTEDCDNPLYDTDNSDAQFLGIAIDGVPIYSQWGGLDEDTLDACHGLEVNGRYVYVAVWKHFPYILGCYRALPDDRGAQVQCPTGEEGEVCLCANGVAGTGLSWFNKCDITCGAGVEDECGVCLDGNVPELAAENSLMEKEESVVDSFLSLMFDKKGRRRRSPRFGRQALGDVDQCHSVDDENYANGQCIPAGGNAPPPPADGNAPPPPAGGNAPPPPAGGNAPPPPADGNAPPPPAGGNAPPPPAGGQSIQAGCAEHPNFCQEGTQCVDDRGFMECLQVYVSNLDVDYTYYPDAEPPSAEHLDEDINKGFGGAYTWLRPVVTTNRQEAASGFEFWRQRRPAIGFLDLAKDTKGDYRYITALTEGGAAVTKVWLQENRPGNGDLCTINLNIRRGGRRLYLCWAQSA